VLVLLLVLEETGFGGVGCRRWPRVGESSERLTWTTGRIRGLEAEFCLRWRSEVYGGRVRGVEYLGDDENELCVRSPDRLTGSRGKAQKYEARW
jgi:hypothetical protein